MNITELDAIYKLTKRINDNLHVNFGMKAWRRINL